MIRTAVAVKPKLGRCKACKAQFPKRSMAHIACSPKCALSLAADAREKKAKADYKKRKEAIKTRSDWQADAQQVINQYVRLRDQHAGHGCISCDRGPNWNGQWHASHFKSVGSNSALRYNLWNIHMACSICNHHLSGNIRSYAEQLPAKIGAERFAWLDTQNHSVKYSAEYLKRLIAVFRKKCNRLKKRMGGTRVDA